MAPYTKSTRANSTAQKRRPLFTNSSAHHVQAHQTGPSPPTRPMVQNSLTRCGSSLLNFSSLVCPNAWLIKRPVAARRRTTTKVLNLDALAVSPPNGVQPMFNRPAGTKRTPNVQVAPEQFTSNARYGTYEREFGASSRMFYAHCPMVTFGWRGLHRSFV